MAYDDDGVIRSYIRASADWFYDQGVDLEVSCDFKKFYDAIRRLDGGYGENLNPAYDYRYNRLDWSNALWIHAVDQSGKTVGQVAAKLVADEANLYEACQCRAKFPHLCRSKIPQIGRSRHAGEVTIFGRPAAWPRRRRRSWRCDGGLRAKMLGHEFGVLTEAVA